MKLLIISEELEKSIVTLFDVALKASGASVLAHIDAIRNAVQVIEEPSLPVEESAMPELKEVPKE